MSLALQIIRESSSRKCAELKTDCPFWPYLHHYSREVKKQLEDKFGAVSGEANVAVNGFLANLAQRLMNIATNVCVAESQILARSRGGASMKLPEFYLLLSNNESYLSDVLVAYPELDRLLTVMVDNFVESTVEFIFRMVVDKEAVLAAFSIDKGAFVVGCFVSEGETHNGGRSVVVVTFNTGQKVVYKPRNLSIEASASDLLKKFCAAAAPPYSEWIIPHYLTRGEHGWAQYIGQKPAKSILDVKDFYMRMGFLIGYCTSIGASDITSDNLIAHGSHPAPIDLETIFYCVLTQRNIPREVRWNASLTSILPNWTWKGTDGIGVDLSALGGLTEQYVSLNLYQHMPDEDSDEFGMNGVKILPNDNVLYLDGEVVQPWLYELEIQAGFKSYFDVIGKRRKEVLADIERFRGAAARYVPRATATYHYAIQCSLHPTLMASTKARKDFLRRILSSDNPPAIGFLESELAACMDGDIPYALIKAGTLSFTEPFYGGEGHLDEKSYQDGIAHSVEYTATMTQSRLKFELNLIGNTLVAMRSMYDHNFTLSEHRFKQDDPLEGLEAYSIEHVHACLRDALTANAYFILSKVQDELNCNGLWLGFHASSGGFMEYSELGDDFYYGLSGILYGCVVAHEYSFISSDLVISLTDLCYFRVMAKLENGGVQLGGFHFGLASTVVPLYLSLVALKDLRAETLVASFKQYLHMALEDELWQKYFLGNDLLMGVSGCLAVVTKLYEITNDEDLPLLANSLYEKGCREWVAPNGELNISFDKSITVRDDGLLSGISHGVMGCAYSIFYYNRLIARSAAVESLFRGMLRWELGEYDAVLCNWRDYRKRSVSKEGEFGWSHGLPGNYLAIKHFAEEGVDIAKQFLSINPVEKHFSFESLRTRKRPANDSMCHGAYGVLNIIKQLCPGVLEDHRIFYLANSLNFCEQDTRALRVRTADAFGLWVGKVGSVVGAVGLVNSEYSFPFLPHQMVLIK